METAYLGESFEQPFRITNVKDPTVTASAATFKVIQNGEIVQSGALAVKEDGITWSFRFVASAVGVNEIQIEYTMGDDRWIEKFLINVVSV